MGDLLPAVGPWKIGHSEAVQHSQEEAPDRAAAEAERVENMTLSSRDVNTVKKRSEKVSEGKVRFPQGPFHFDPSKRGPG